MKGCLYIECVDDNEFSVCFVEDQEVPVWHTVSRFTYSDEAFAYALRVAGRHRLFTEARRILDAWERGDRELPLTADIQARENAIAGEQ